MKSKCLNTIRTRGLFEYFYQCRCDRAVRFSTTLAAAGRKAYHFRNVIIAFETSKKVFISPLKSFLIFSPLCDIFFFIYSSFSLQPFF